MRQRERREHAHAHAHLLFEARNMRPQLTSSHRGPPVSLALILPSPCSVPLSAQENAAGETEYAAPPPDAATAPFRVNPG